MANIMRFGVILNVVNNLEQTITIDYTKIDATLSNYPIMVKLTTSNFDFSKVRSDGNDIAFYDMSNNLLAFEVEYYESNVQGVYHVKIPSISSTVNTTFKMKYGNLSQSTSLQNKTAVWDSNFLLVQHMGDSLLDSTSNGNNLTATGTSVISGINGQARSFNGVSDYLSRAVFYTSNSNVTMSALTQQASVTKGAIITNGTNTSNNGYSIGIGAVSSFDVVGQNFIGLYGGIRFLNPSIIITTSTHLTLKFASSKSPYLSMNGGSQVLVSGIASQPAGGNFLIGANAENGVMQSGRFFNGTIDEVRISNIARSDAWIKADDYNLRLNTLITIGG